MGRLPRLHILASKLSEMWVDFAQHAVSWSSETLPNKTRKSSQYGPMHESKSAPALFQLISTPKLP